MIFKPKERCKRKPKSHIVFAWLPVRFGTPAYAYAWLQFVYARAHNWTSPAGIYTSWECEQLGHEDLMRYSPMYKWLIEHGLWSPQKWSYPRNAPPRDANGRLIDEHGL